MCVCSCSKAPPKKRILSEFIKFAKKKLERHFRTFEKAFRIFRSSNLEHQNFRYKLT